MKTEQPKRNRVAVLGSTGSIGRQTLAVTENLSDLFEVECLTSNSNWELLAQQARRFDPNCVVIADKQYYTPLKEALKDTDVKVYAGAEAVEQVAAGSQVDTVVSAIVGYAGMAPTLNALKHGKRVALANKESLVVAGDLVMKTARECKAPVIPVDSEHSAIFQCLMGEAVPARKVILTASGGPFFGKSSEELQRVTVQEALNHPRWVMGNKITIDSATLVNKGLEVIEAKYLFDLTADQIEVRVHPQSIVHSMVEFADGAIKAQLGIPNMSLPIQYALTFPARMPIAENALSFGDFMELHFYAPDRKTFRALDLAYEVARKGGNSGCVLNAANEVAVAAFLEGRIAFTRIAEVIEEALQRIQYRPVVSGVEEYRLWNEEARRVAARLIEK